MTTWSHMETVVFYPKDTFWNLAEEKRNRIIREAVREFAVHGYRRASLNTIVGRLGIAKGSLYQYFTNKEALFLFVFDQFTEQVKAVLSRSVEAGQGLDFWATIRGALLAGVCFVSENPQLFNLYLKVLFESEVPHREELVARVRLFSRDFFGPLCDEGVRQGALRQDVSVTAMSFILDAAFDRFLQGLAQPYLDGGLGLAAMDSVRLEQEIDCVLDILRQGLMARAGAVKNKEKECNGYGNEEL